MQNLDATPITGPVTEEQRTYALDALRSTAEALHQSVAGLNEARLNYKPADNRWSIAENLEHIVLVEAGLMAGIQKGMTYPANPDKRANVRLIDVDVIKAVRSRAVTFPAPDPFVPTGRFGDSAGSLAAFDAGRAQTIAFVETVAADLRQHYIRHIALGWLDCYQGVLTIAAHGERHRKQIEEIKANAGFPAL
jgi:hypothetical protein